ncbi:fibroblast growth factor receptor homolog 1-like isoform X2 [Plodia interpunctella]|uniref:fibroblast growth factor receptor homolog 1-like isoform X2 n=1 Tax=Plodia interpunctella TaxID=58824 RepID=UPI002368B01D|nr:fibroblast growth factor receptor homolog 1-like isoform X2 [Plodia interpunctella]
MSRDTERRLSLVAIVLLATTCVSHARDVILDDSYTAISVSTNERLRLICGLRSRSGTEWLRDDQPVKLSRRITQQKQWLRIRSFHPEDAGVYSCRPADDGSILSVLIRHKDEDQHDLEYQSDGEIKRSSYEEDIVKLLKNTEDDKNYRSARNLVFKDDNTNEDIDNVDEVDEPLGKYPPKFANERMFLPKTKTVGSTVRLRCVAEGNPTPNITWRRDNAHISRDPEPEYIKWSVELEELTKDDEGNYTCVVCNELGCIERDIELFITDLQTLNVDLKRPIPEILAQHRAVDDNNTAVNSRVAKNVNVKDDDTEDKNDKDHHTYGDLDNSTTMFAPRFKHLSKMYAAEIKPAGSTIKLKCAAEGNPTPNITWKKNDENITRTYFRPVYGKWSLTLEEMTKADDGNYTCIVCNILGCIQHNVEVSVIERFPAKPYIREGYPGNKTAIVNSTVLLSCPPFSDLEPEVQWYRLTNFSANNGEVGPMDAPIPPGYQTESENPDDKPEQLTIYNVTKDDEGWYVCIASNALGNSTAIGYLTVVESMPVPEQLDHGKHTFLINVLTVVLGAMFLVAAVIVVMIFKKLKREKIKKQLALETARAVIVTHWTKKVTVEKPQMNGTANPAEEALLMPVVKIEKQKLQQVQGGTNSDSMMMSEYELPVDIDWEVARESLALGKVLGEGEFGKVVKAECVGIVKQGVPSVVAVKMLKEGHTDAEMMALVSEMEMMKMIGKHVNIINLLGCCTQDGPLYVIVEYAPNGNLREFLRNHRPGNRYEPLPTENVKEKKTLTQKDLVSFSYQVARGMEYLASRRCIHRDLAARNVLVSDNCVLKIADFGLAKDVQSNDYYRKKTEGRLPVRWMAPESLYHKVFTTQTDVWSFGVLLWEIMTLGGTPYPTVPGQYMYQHLSAGHRMEKPPCCSLEIYMLMRECWSFSPGDRPSFTELVEDLDKILTVTANQEYLDLGLPQLDTPPSSYDGSGDESDSEFPFITNRM